MKRLKPRIYFALFALCALLIGLAVFCLRGQDCSQSTPSTSSDTEVSQKESATSDDELSQNIDRDHLLGWYKLPEREHVSHKVIPGHDTLIPVFKRDGTYYSVCRGFEVPLKECPEGLEWGLTESSMVGTKIIFDEASNTYYISIMDKWEMSSNDHSLRGGKQPMTRIDKPSWLLDATAQPPRINDDFLGWYQPVWFPFVRLEIRKDGQEYLSVEHEFHELGVWKTPHEPQEITPLPDRLGLTGFDRGTEVSLTYNEAMRRIEITMSGSPIIRMPLARVSPEGATVRPPMAIGIPSWH